MTPTAAQRRARYLREIRLATPPAPEPRADDPPGVALAKKVEAGWRHDWRGERLRQLDRAIAANARPDASTRETRRRRRLTSGGVKRWLDRHDAKGEAWQLRRAQYLAETGRA